MSNTGIGNSGNRNSGNRNSGNYNSGHWNSGDRNSGSSNSGYYNSGDGNSGDRNSGSWNSGSWNSGDGNSGHWNSGSWNSGHGNSGHWNSADGHAGHFNTKPPEMIYCFDRLINKEDWENAYKPGWLYEPMPTTWVSVEDMTDKEKADNPDYKALEGFLRKNDMKQEWRRAYETASQKDIQAVLNLPGFDSETFEKITGIKIEPITDSCDGREIVIDGIVYELKEKK